MGGAEQKVAFGLTEVLDYRGEGIVGLKSRIDALTGYEQEIARRILWVQESEGVSDPPPEMIPFILKQFGPDGLEKVRCQKIVRVSNRVTRAGALFNELRASRPVQTPDPQRLDEMIDQGKVDDPFASPETGTPRDDFGRIYGEHSVTASNVAKYDARHGLVIFNEFDPLNITEEQLIDYFRVVREYWQKSHEQDPQAIYPFLAWHCL